MAKIQKNKQNAEKSQAHVTKSKINKPKAKKSKGSPAATALSDGSKDILVKALQAKQKQSTKKAAKVPKNKKEKKTPVAEEQSEAVAQVEIQKPADAENKQDTKIPDVEGEVPTSTISKKELKAKKKRMLKELKADKSTTENESTEVQTQEEVSKQTPPESNENKSAEEKLPSETKSNSKNKAGKRKAQKANEGGTKKAKTEDSSGDIVNKEKDKSTKTDLNATIFVGNLPQNIKDKNLISLFNDCGKIQSVRLRTAVGNVLFKHKTRKETESLIAFVTFESVESVEKALAFSGIEFRDRILRVTKANKKEITSEDSVRRTVFVGNLKYAATENSLHDLFSSCGEIESVRTVKTVKGCKGVAYVCFKKQESVGLAMELNETLLFDRPIRVEKYSIKKSGAANKTKNASTDEKRAPREHKKKALKKAQGESGKKSSFRGVKVKRSFKKTKNNKPNTNPIQRKLAAKIAPKL